MGSNQTYQHQVFGQSSGQTQIPSGSELTLPNLFASASKSVVQVTIIDPQSGSQQGIGSGFVYDSAGHIATNNHVVAFNFGNNEYIVTFLNGNAYEASLVGNDPFSDLAVLKLLNPKATDVHPLTLSTSLPLVGDTAVAIGNPFGLSGSLTVGVISAVGRLLPTSGGQDSQFMGSTASSFDIPDVIQTDAAINPGNSGGPLLNMKNEVIGINSAIYSNTGSNAGIGFAIPSSTIKKVVQSIITSGEYQHPYLGVTGVDVTPQLAKIFGLVDAKGFLVTDITPGSPASRAGFRTGGVTYDQQGQITNSYGDIIIKIDGNDVRKIDDILTYLEREKKVNDTVTLTVIRDNQLTDLSMVLGARPTQQEDLAAGEFGDQSAPELGGEYSECPSYVPQSLCDLFAQ
ncbi:MAG TPA: trypsin-like peptidase domain-containing protein [Nitrososphaeraceae archaeon]